MIGINTSDQSSITSNELNPLLWAETGLNADTHESAWDKLSAILADIGFEKSAFLHGMPVEKATKSYPLGPCRSGLVISTAWEEFMAANPDGAATDPIGRRLQLCDTLVNTVPSLSILPKLTATEQASMDRFQDFGMTAGAAFSIHDKRTHSFSGLMVTHTGRIKEYVDVYQKHIQDVMFAAVFLAEAYSVRDLVESDCPPKLSPREKECLTWVSAGRTTTAISDILCISDETVNEYLANAANKLNASNRTQAAARAVMLEIIQP